MVRVYKILRIYADREIREHKYTANICTITVPCCSHVCIKEYAECKNLKPIIVLTSLYQLVKYWSSQVLLG